SEPKLISCDIDGGQRSAGFLPLLSPHNHAVGATCAPATRVVQIPQHVMRQLIRAGAIPLAIFGSVGFAAAQKPPGSDLTATQQRTVSQGLASSPSQAAPAGTQPQVG